MGPIRKYVAIAAFYRDPRADGSWRLVVPRKQLSADEPLKLQLMADGLIVSDGLPASGSTGGNVCG
jgi:type VI secretion system protein VasD